MNSQYSYLHFIESFSIVNYLHELFFYCHLLQYSFDFISSVFSTFESEFSDVIPVVHASIADTRIVGRLCVGINQ